MLSIIILFCDKDFQYLPALIMNIEKCVFIPYELIFIDNRENNKEPFKLKDNWQYHSFGYNARQVRGRKKGIELAKGKYIWFVDADDSINEVSDRSLLESECDMIVFQGKADYVQRLNILSYKVLCTISVPLWNKWIKTDVLRKVEENIPADLDGSASEDTMLVIGSMKFSKSIQYCSTKIYNYNVDRSSCGREQIESTEHFSRIIYGHDKVVECMMKMLTDEDRYNLGLCNHLIDDCTFFLRKIAGCSEDIIEECVKIITHYFTEEQIIKTWKLSAASVRFTEKKYFLAKNAFEKIFPDRADDFKFFGKKTYYRKNTEGVLVPYKEELREVYPPFISNK